MEDKLQFFVNGKKVTEENPDPKWTLLWYLRNKLGLFGAKNACGEGGCGACTVMVSKVNPETKEIRNLAMNACIMPVCSLQGAAVVTVEGLGSVKSGLHPIQERVGKAGGGGAACGFCTPGFVMSMYALLRNNPGFSGSELEEVFLGNLCRCGGYGIILDTFRRSICPKGQQCCKMKSNKEPQASGKEPQDLRDTCQDPIFPPELQLNAKDYLMPLKFEKAGTTWYTPDTLQNFLELKQRFPNAKIAAGFTEIQFEVRQASNFPQVLIHPTAAAIPEMAEIEINNETGCLVIGGLENFTNFKTFCGARQKENLVFKACSHMLNRFGDVQTRNAATIGGSLASGSVGSDSNTLFAALGASVLLESHSRSVTQLLLNSNFFKTSSGGTSLKSDQVITKLVIPLAKPGEFIWYGKQSRRHDVDVALLNCAVKLRLSQQGQIEDAVIVLNGLALTHLTIANALSASLIGRSVDQSLLEFLTENGSSLLPASSTDPTLSAEYRQALLEDMWLRFFKDLESWVSTNSNGQEFNFFDGIWSKKASLPEAEDAFQKTREDTARPVLAALATGEAQFLDDFPPLEGQLFGAFVTTTECFARIVSIDYEIALQSPGVVKIFDSKDDDSVFASGQVQAYGQPIALVVATSSLIAKEAAGKVKVEYETVEGAVLGIEDAIASLSFCCYDIEEKGAVQKAFKSASAFIKSQVNFGGQKWLQMEPPAALAVPDSSGNKFKITLNTVISEDVRKMVAQSLNVDLSQIEVAAHGTSDNETEATDSVSSFLAVSVAVAAKKLQKPVRCALSCADAFKISGGRHPAACKYQMALDTSGKITAVQADVYLLGGFTANCSMVVLQTLFHSMASLLAHIPNYSLRVHRCKSNTPSKSIVFGEGLLQATFFAQSILDIEYKPESSQSWDQVLKSCDYEQRAVLVQELNEKNSRIKRGIYAMPIYQSNACETSMALLDQNVASSVGGAAVCTEVELDALTGEYRILRTDIVVIGVKDKASKIDAVLKRAFMEGVGAFTTEQILVSPEGALISTGPGTYKLPNVSSFPREFKIHIFEDPDPSAIASSELDVLSAKPIGLLASISVFFAIKEAVKSVRAQAGLSLVDFSLDAPATYEAVRMACSTI